MEKRKPAVKERKQEKKQRKVVKDPNQPKRPPSAFFVFMEEFRKTYKEEHPSEKSVSVIGKAGGNKWKYMSDEEKSSYVAEAAKRKAAYTKSMADYKNKEPGDQKAEQENGYADSEEEESEDE